MQYTVRNVPVHVDQALRRKAREQRRSLNEVLRAAIMKEADEAGLPARVHTDLDGLAGAWVDQPGFDDAIRAQDEIDQTLWR